MKSGLLKFIIALPGTVLIFIPGLILWSFKNTTYSHSFSDIGQIGFWVGVILLLMGIILAAWTVRLQLTKGQGTPAPWDPPKKLVVAGPYRHVRNPMISGVLFILTAEALLLRSWPIAWWMIIFIFLNMIYFPKFEERDLEKRFGEEYLEYKKNVPRWIPRISPWNFDQS